MDPKDHEMTKGEWERFKYQIKLDKIIEYNRYYCYCGHSVTILPKESRVFCTHCGHWVYKDKRKQNQNIKRIKKENQEKLARIKREQFKEQLKENIKNAI